MTFPKRYAESLLLLAVDSLLLVLCMALAVMFRIVVLPEVYPSPLTDITEDNILYSLWIILVWLFFMGYEGLYTKRFSFWDEIRALWKVAFLSTVGVFVIVSIGKLSDFVPRTIVILTGCFALPVLPAVRINCQRFLRRWGLFRRRVIIVGAGELGRLTRRALDREPHFGYQVIGFVDDEISNGRHVDGIKIHRGLARIGRYIGACRVSNVFIAIPEIGRDRLQELINKVQSMVERVLVVPDLKSIPIISADIQHFFHEQIFCLEIRNNLKKRHNLIMKRLFDLWSSLLLTAIFLLPMCVLSLFIMMESPGSPVFTHQRVGRNGRIIRVYKFRTMFRDADARLEELIRRDGKARAEWEEFRKLKNDPRVTRVGNFLRKTSLDELPQLINVLKGEMSLVGPRPVTSDEIAHHYRDLADLCFSVPPGITGLWQVSGRSDLDYPFRVMLDSWYVRNWSLWLDIVILMKTVKIVLKAEGAY